MFAYSSEEIDIYLYKFRHDAAHLYFNGYFPFNITQGIFL